MKNCIWLKPQMVGQFEFTEWTPDGHLRHSKFCGFREDKNPRGVISENRNGGLLKAARRIRPAFSFVLINLIFAVVSYPIDLII
jgi:hypothetical protein